ncbi:MAG TPA: hypothetical protein VE441_01535 [Mycobacterium sp.]|jgi:hypothetical protein|nr:hypothetical protein [Mycobacterium sp.]
MSDRSDPSSWPCPRGPWPEVTDLSRLYDHGQPWCVNARAHPDRNHGYPDPNHHLPWHECRSDEIAIDDARRNIDGNQVGLTVYLAAAFRFGQPRDTTDPPSTRIVIETWRPDTDEPSQRVSLNPGSALRLARILARLVDELTFVTRAA